MGTEQYQRILGVRRVCSNAPMRQTRTTLDSLEPKMGENVGGVMGATMHSMVHLVVGTVRWEDPGSIMCIRSEPQTLARRALLEHTRRGRTPLLAATVEPGRILQALEARCVRSASQDTTLQAVQTQGARSARRGSGPDTAQRPVLHSLRFQQAARSHPDSRHLCCRGTTTHRTRVACGATA